MGTKVVYGVAGSANAITIEYSPGSHNLQQWGNEYKEFSIGTLGAGVLITANQAAWMSPFPYAYVYDVLVENLTSGTGTHTVSLYNAVSGGSRWGFLNTDITIAASIAALTQTSARFAATPAYHKQADPELAPAYWRNTAYASNPYLIERGDILSVRVATQAATGAFTGLVVKVILHVSDNPFLG